MEALQSWTGILRLIFDLDLGRMFYHCGVLLVQGVFANRFRDVSEEIRATAIGGIGEWVKALPSVFLQDQYLKYLAWAMSDKVRLQTCS